MKKSFIKFSMGLCLVAMLGSSSFNLNAAGGGGGGDDDEKDGMYLFTVSCSDDPNIMGGTRKLCWDAVGHKCRISAQTECAAE
jgi:hypothetical protein